MALETQSRAFDIKTATSLIQIYDGNHEATEAFIESMELLDELTPAEHKNIMIKFIKTRITGKAKLALTDNINSVEAIRNKLRQKFSARTSTDAVLAQLRTARQGNKKLADFANQIENLSSQLTRALIAENVATGEAAEKLAEKFAVQSFIENISNRETALILKASNCTALSEIITKAATVDNEQPSNVLHYKVNQPRKPNKGRSNWHNRNSNRYNNNTKRNNSRQTNSYYNNNHQNL